MTEFVSDIKKIPYSDKIVFDVLSDLSKLELMKDRLPADKITDFTCEQDSCSFSVAPVGRVTFLVVDREPNKTIKFKSEQLPFEINAWVQLVSKADDDTRIKITLKADLNPFIKPMVSKPMKDAVDKIAEVIASLPFDKLQIKLYA